MVGAGCLALLLSACALSGTAPRSAGEENPSPAGLSAAIGGLRSYGRADYNWALRTLDGAPVELEAYRGKVLFINLWASWCAPCVAEMAGIQRLRDSLR